ncbi:hypothetical protein DPEC_G00081760 [Dallia pectoralis]|uniref:Uncharacterized protein n=1 Tax=Dallia pectoralis TaxID=75939 RepID=A0ACC2GZ06_DALPE|nr:hypothetical protein DPEC_G00081760 [Dallia pectoralis]
MHPAPPALQPPVCFSLVLRQSGPLQSGPPSAVMKPALWSLLVLVCLSSPGRSDCQGDCLACGSLLPPPRIQTLGQQQGFNSLVCLLECEGHLSPAPTWELCQRATPPHYPYPPEGGSVSKRAEEALSLNLVPGDLESDGELLYSAAMEGYQDGEDQEGNAPDPDDPNYDSYGSTENDDSLGLENRVAENRKRSAHGEDEEEEAVVQLIKRFGGFQKGRHGYKKLIGGPVGRPLQKRLGGFIGIRKSARKWNNQKRVSRLLRQYLEMTSSRTSGRRFSNPGPWPKRQHKRL